MFVVEDDAAGPRIRDVPEGSPASEAGLKVGDVIVSIDRTPAQGMTLDYLRRRFLNEGRVAAVTVQRGAATIQAKTRLRRLIERRAASSPIASDSMAGDDMPRIRRHRP